MKIHIIGGSGSGKTYLADKLSKEYGITHYDLDELQWDNKADSYGVKRNAEERQEILEHVFTVSIRHICFYLYILCLFFGIIQLLRCLDIK